MTSSADVQIELLVWDRASGTVQLEVRGDNNQPRHVAFSPSGNVIAATAEGPSSLTSWEIVGRNEVWSFRRRATIRDAQASEIAVSDDGRLLSTSGRIWDAESGAFIKEVPVQGPAAFLAHSTRLVSLAYEAVREDECRACRPVSTLVVDAQHDLAAAARRTR